jgi:predicted  nucleic acid-binding Zn-ribbon protein
MTSQTNEITAVLRTLHRIHRQLNDLRERLERGPKVARAREANVKRLEETVAEVQTAAKTIRCAADEKQLQLKAGEEKIQKYQRQLNEAKTNAEYQALKDQIAATRMTNSVLEDEILETMDKVDELRSNAEKAQADLAQARGEAGKTAEDVEKRQPKIHADLERLEAELKESEAALPAEFLEVYRRLVRQRGDEAMAPLEGEFCGGCNQHVPLNLCSQVILSKPVFCKSCGRLLYLPEGRDR